MEADDLLADHVYVGGPVALEFLLLVLFFCAQTDSGAVVAQRIEPHVHHVPGITGNRNAPLEGAAADREIAQTALYEGNHLIAPRFWPDETWFLLVMRQQLVGEGRKLKVIVLFAGRLGRATAFGAGSAGTHGIDIKLVKDAVLARVCAFVDKTLVLDTLPQFLSAAFVARLGGADEVIVGDAHLVKQPAEFSRGFVHPLLRRRLCGRGGALHVNAMLVRAGQKPGVIAQHALAAGNRVADQRGVSVADVRPRVHVINGRGDIKLFSALIHGLFPDKP